MKPTDELILSDQNIHEYQAVSNSDGTIILEEGNIMLHRQTDGEVVCVSYDAVRHWFPVGEDSDTENENAMVDAGAKRVIWWDNEIVELAYLYKQYDPLVKRGTMKNSKMWKTISEKIPRHTAIQCENQMKYLKKKYNAKNDNMLGKSTGAKRVNFKHFNLFKDLFGAPPNIRPICVASSSRGIRNMDPIAHCSKDEQPILDSTAATTLETQPESSVPNTLKRVRDLSEGSDRSTPKRQKESRLAKRVTELNNLTEAREEARERRHQDQMQIQQQFLEVFKQFVNVLADKLGTMK